MCEQEESNEEKKNRIFQLVKKIQLKLPKSQATDITFIKHMHKCVSKKQIWLGFENVSKQWVIVKEGKNNPSWIPDLDLYYELETFCDLLDLEQDSMLEHLPVLIDVRLSETQNQIITKWLPLQFNKIFHNHVIPCFNRRVVCDLIQIVKYLHRNNIFHRDIKSTNICFDTSGKLVLIDFGSATTNDISTTLSVCTVTTRAPEQFQDAKSAQEYSAAAGDWWSVGCVICHMYLGEPLFYLKDTETDIPTQINFFLSLLHSECGHPKLSKVCPEEIYRLIQGLMSRQPDVRTQTANRFFLII